MTQTLTLNLTLGGIESGLIVRDRVGSGLGLGLTGVRVRWGSGSLGFGLGLTLGVEVGLVVPRHITHRP